MQPAVGTGLDPGDVVADGRDLPALEALGGTSIAKLVLPQALGKAAATWTSCPAALVTPRISMCSASQPWSRPMVLAMRSAKHFLPSSALPP
jgi:hypothetical protein